MKKKRITISYVAENDTAFYIETLIRSNSIKVIQDNGGTAVKLCVENLPVENDQFEIKKVCRKM